MGQLTLHPKPSHLREKLSGEVLPDCVSVVGVWFMIRVCLKLSSFTRDVELIQLGLDFFQRELLRVKLPIWCVGRRRRVGQTPVSTSGITSSLLNL